MQQPESSVLLTHIVSQTRQNIDFLIFHNIISQADASLLLSKLPDASILTLANRTQTLAVAPVPSTGAYLAQESRDVATYQSIVQARALWDYNYQGLEPNDLSFRAGDIIDIVTETNADWWTGRLNNREGLFPSSYVEKINDTSKSQSPPTTSPCPDKALVPAYQGAPYQPVAGYQGPVPPSNQGVVQSSYSNQPPQQITYNLYTNPPPATQVQPPPSQPPQKGKIGGLGSTLAHSAVGGAGFGAASAVGSGIVNALF